MTTVEWRSEVSAVTRRTDSITPLLALGVIVLVLAGAVSVWTIAGWWSGSSSGFVNPAEAIRDGAPWTTTHTAAAVLVGAAIVAVIAMVLVVVLRRGRDRSPADGAAPKMGTGRDIAPLLPGTLRKRHNRMGIPPQFLGVTVGHTVAGRLPLRASYEDTVSVIAGPRRNKSASIVIPNILAAPGTLLATSVKPDILAETLTVRAAAGTVRLFDPQRLAGAYDDYSCWWNPLARITSVEDCDKLAAVFTAATYGTGADDDAFFSSTGRTLISRYLFAASVEKLYLPAVLQWLTDETDSTPARILEESYPHLADDVDAAQAVTQRTRSGVFAYAREALSFLASESVRCWVQPREGRPEFDPEEFVTARADTLYLFSEEGPGSAGPLLAALTRAVLSAAENAAKREPSGRLPVPLMAILDEAGNICRIPDLPEKYTHYGSRGIIPITILQTQEQGEQVWGQTGFGQLWASSTVRVFGGGNASNSFLRDLSELIGDYEYTERSTSTHDGKRTVNTSRRSERIMDVSDLASLTLGRMVVFASGCRPALVRSIPWWKDKALTKLNAAAISANRTGDDGT
ncbi:TraM recognition domain-containing protein [Salinibacterium sp. G-O1]|uniref:type IV secretory system conjugative DNA transfer family protein n=1 Tax=Salinibacterium sp. G-O1 TaxID=3046208 RepID=UPI0024BB2E18|nr:type IV secretory system conjugative DNA transfer family protein [Salinibacterium sp. G-O1]MDJ0336594.1 TraM recognition domain-containing protein [Salinibacterium sp. G-O1]